MNELCPAMIAANYAVMMLAERGSLVFAGFLGMVAWIAIYIAQPRRA